jgi:dTDP-glucose 4,6-dehydratase
MVRRPDTALATDVLGWEPEVPWTEGLARTVDWFREAVASDTVSAATRAR